MQHFADDCDVGGGHGYLLAALLRDRRQAKGIVFDLPEVTAARDVEITAKDGLAGRINHQGGDMFEAISEADIYLRKHILHDWNDDECITLLGGAAACPLAARAHASAPSRRFA
jgi:hypothetical protein